MEGAKARLRIGDILVGQGRLTPELLEKALEVQAASRSRKRLGAVLVELGLCSGEAIADALSAQFGLLRVDDRDLVPDTGAIEALGLDFCRRHEVLPLIQADESLALAMSDPLSLEVVDLVRRTLDRPIEPAAAAHGAILHHLGMYSGPAGAFEELVRETYEAVSDADEPDDERRPLAAHASATPTVSLVDEILSRAIEHKASDIHIEPGPESVTIRFRVDGALRQILQYPMRLLAATVARIKVMADMDITERRVPQDGHLAHTEGGATTDFRVSTLPTTRGEKCVLRLLGTTHEAVGLEQLGFTEGQLEAIGRAIGQSQGCIIVAGPTGSGKTTTLYACLTAIQDESLNITTVEDPVERDIPEIAQTQVHEVAGVTFASSLRAMLRQDPDVIMVGEIRDGETAEIAMRASLTGHLVLTTVHANDAVATLVRLRDLEIDGYLVSSGLSLITAQRLLRRLCPRCRRPATPDRVQSILLRDALGELPETPLYASVGCETCDGRGYSGRIVVAEVLPFGDEIRMLAAQGASEADVRGAARSAGMRWMFEEGVRLVVDGSTSMDELMRVVPLPRSMDALERHAIERRPAAALPRSPELQEPLPPSTESFKEFCSSLGSVPAVPMTLAQLQDLLAEPELDVAALAQAIESDDVAAARVLRAVNSPIFDPPSEILSIAEGIARMGVAQVMGLLVATTVLPTPGTAGAGVIDIDDVWLHSFATATCCRELSRRVDGIHPAEAGMAGLLHDVGRVILAQERPEQMRQCLRATEASAAPLWQSEMQFLGFTHGDVGTWLLESWRLPRAIAQCARELHGAEGGGDVSPLAKLVALADDSVKEAGLGNSGDPTVMVDRSALLEDLGLSELALDTAVACARYQRREYIRMRLGATLGVSVLCPDPAEPGSWLTEEGYFEDLSVGGAQVQVRHDSSDHAEAIKQAERIRVEISAATPGRAPSALDAEVVRLAQEVRPALVTRLGLRWCNLGPEQSERLSQLMVDDEREALVP